MKNHISQEQLDRLIKDAKYLQDEAEALKYVIDDVPYQEKPPGGLSIAERLLLIDHAQLSYFRPALKQAVQNPRPTHTDQFEHFKNSFRPDEKKLNDVQKILSKLAKHRAGVINTMENISLIDWDTIIYENNHQIILFDFAERMIRFDRSQLKKIADLVRIHKNEKRSRRELDQRRAQRDRQSQQNTQQ